MCWSTVNSFKEFLLFARVHISNCVWVRQVNTPFSGWRPDWQYLYLESGRNSPQPTDSRPGRQSKPTFAHCLHRIPFLMKALWGYAVSWRDVTDAGRGYLSVSLVQSGSLRVISGLCAVRQLAVSWWLLLDDSAVGFFTVSVLSVPRCLCRRCHGPGWRRPAWSRFSWRSGFFGPCRPSPPSGRWRNCTASKGTSWTARSGVRLGLSWRIYNWNELGRFSIISL